MITDRIVLVLAALSATTAGKAVGQDRVVDTLSRAGICEQAKRTLQDRPSGQRYASTVSELPACATDGAAALRAQWAQLPGDTALVRVLGEVTPRLRDRSLFESVLGVYRDASRPLHARLAALNSLVGYYKPGLIVVYVEPEVAVQHGSAYVLVGRGDPTAINGAVPLSSGTRGQILAALDQVAQQDPDARLRLISAYIRTRLAALGQA
jgi:hypothetical protein